MSDCFMCARLTEAAKAAEANTKAAVIEMTKYAEMVAVKTSRIDQMKRAAVVALRSAEGFPRCLVLPHIRPTSAKVISEKPDRFALLELE